MLMAIWRLLMMIREILDGLDKEQVIELLKRVCTVSVETMKIIEEMPPANINIGN